MCFFLLCLFVCCCFFSIATSPTFCSVFLGRLPDRGEKVRKHADNLRAALTSRQMVDDAAKQLEEMSLGPAPGEAPAPAKAMLVRYQGRPTQQVSRASILMMGQGRNIDQNTLFLKIAIKGRVLGEAAKDL